MQYTPFCEQLTFFQNYDCPNFFIFCVFNFALSRGKVVFQKAGLKIWNLEILHCKDIWKPAAKLEYNLIERWKVILSIWLKIQGTHDFPLLKSQDTHFNLLTKNKIIIYTVRDPENAPLQKSPSMHFDPATAKITQWKIT